MCCGQDDLWMICLTELPPRGLIFPAWPAGIAEEVSEHSTWIPTSVDRARGKACSNPKQTTQRVCVKSHKALPKARYVTFFFFLFTSESYFDKIKVALSYLSKLFVTFI